MAISNGYYRYINKESHEGPLLLSGNHIIKLLPILIRVERTYFWLLAWSPNMPSCKRRPSSLLSNHMRSILGIFKLGLIDDDFILQNIVCLGIHSELVTSPISAVEVVATLPLPIWTILDIIMEVRLPNTRSHLASSQWDQSIVIASLSRYPVETIEVQEGPYRVPYRFAMTRSRVAMIEMQRSCRTSKNKDHGQNPNGNRRLVAWYSSASWRIEGEMEKKKRDGEVEERRRANHPKVTRFGCCKQRTLSTTCLSSQEANCNNNTDFMFLQAM